MKDSAFSLREIIIYDIIRNRETMDYGGDDMHSNTRRHYIDNLRWMILLILIPYHAAMAWNVWGEPNYINFEGNRLISSIVVFFSPYFMPLLFVLSGIGTRFALRKRSTGEYIAERVKRLLPPFVFGTIVLMPVMTYIADRFNCGYEGGFFRHYAVFFTRFTDLTGADGGFSFGQFWFLLYLLVISILSALILSLIKKADSESGKAIPFWSILLLGLPLPLLSELLSIGGKSLAEYIYLFLLGYFVFSNEDTIAKAEKNCWLLSGAGLAAAVLNVYLFLWSGKNYDLLNTAAKYVSEWVMIIALIGLAKRYLNFTGKVSGYMGAKSFLFYTYHFVWVVLFQYVLHSVCGSNVAVLFFGSVMLAYPATFACCDITARVPFMCFVTGTKYTKGRNDRTA